jgi:hypothetical protein
MGVVLCSINVEVMRFFKSVLGGRRLAPDGCETADV